MYAKPWGYRLELNLSRRYQRYTLITTIMEGSIDSIDLRGTWNLITQVKQFSSAHCWPYKKVSLSFQSFFQIMRPTIAVPQDLGPRHWMFWVLWIPELWSSPLKRSCREKFRSWVPNWRGLESLETPTISQGLTPNKHYEWISTHLCFVLFPLVWVGLFWFVLLSHEHPEVQRVRTLGISHRCKMLQRLHLGRIVWPRLLQTTVT